MKKLLSVLYFLPLFAGAQTSLSFTQSSTADIFSPGRGAEQWQHLAWDNTSGQGVKIPAGNITPGPNYYTRFAWLEIESNTVSGSYSWTIFDQRIHQAMDAHQMFSFGVMPICDGCTIGQIPNYLHVLMQAETNKDWLNPDGYWVPNWGSPNYLARYKALLNAIANHIATTSYTPSWSGSAIPYSKVIYYVDIRGFGNYGEWHQSPWYNAAGIPGYILNPSQATLDTLINYNLQAFPTYPNVILEGAFSDRASSFIPHQTTYYALNASNAWGLIGWRRDNWGDSTNDVILKNNSGSYSGPANDSNTLIIIAGESNASGMALNSQAPANQVGTRTEVQIQPNQNSTQFSNLKIDLIANGGNNQLPSGISATFGMELALANMVDSGYFQPVYLAKFCAGGTKIADWIGPSGTNYVQFIHWLDSAFNQMNRMGKPYRVYVWQSIGINDNGGGTPLDSFRSRMSQFRAQMRARYSRSDMKFLVTDFSNPSFGYTYPWQATIDSMAITDNGGTWAISCDKTNYVSGQSPVHWDLFGLGTVAHNMVSRMVNNKAANSLSGNTFFFKDYIVTRYKNAPVVGEPLQSSPAYSCGSPFCDLIREVNTYHTAAIGNGNYGGSNATLSTVQSNVQTASAAEGYRYTLTGGTMTTTLTPSGPFNITLNWSNLGVAPTYENWTITFELRNGASVFWSGTSTFNPKPFLPGTLTQSDNFTLTAIASGTYSLYIKISDPNGYKLPMALGITGRGTDGAYLIRSGITVGSASNLPPTAQITGSTSITLPQSSVSLDGTTSFDPDGTIASYLWTQLSGPNTGSFTTSTSSITTYSGLVAGTYNVKLQVTDNSGASASDTITIVVNPAVTGELTVFTTQTAPITNLNDGLAIELGMKFRSSIPTKVTGIRFYKVTGNNGTHIGELYDGSGNRLAQATFTSESNNGWQRVNFASPVSILANTTYVAAYYSPGGYYLETDNTFASAVTNSTLTGLASGTDGPNGIYTYSVTPAFPSSYFSDHKPNYWVDPITNATAVTAEAGINQLIYIPAATVILDAVNSIGTITSYLWTQVSGPNTATITSPSSQATSATGLIPGTYIFQLSLNGGTSTDQVTVNVYYTGTKLSIHGAKPKTITGP